MTQDTALRVLKMGFPTLLTGEAGSGKTHTLNQFKKSLDEMGIVYAVTASTGIAATHIDGVTIHSWAGIGVKKEITDDDLADIMNKPHVVNAIKNCDILIIDEVSMLSARVLDNVEKVVRHIKGNILDDTPFGGMQVIFVGDFFQLPPVSRKGEPKEDFIFNSATWKRLNMAVCYLTEQHRQQDPVFTEVLTAFRNGRLTDSHKKILQNNNVDKIPVTKLFTHNADVDFLNNQELKRLKTQEEVFYMETGGNDFLVNKLKEYCLSPEKLVLKVGAPVMFTRNDFESGYVNGTLGEITDIDDEKITIVTNAGKTIVLREKTEWSIEKISRDKNTGKPRKVKEAYIKQYPLRLAWAITIHKSQGMSLDSAVIDLSKAFEDGQGYVAISRVRSLSGLFIEGINEKAYNLHPEVKEIDLYLRKKSSEMEEELTNFDSTL